MIAPSSNGSDLTGENLSSGLENREHSGGSESDEDGGDPRKHVDG